LAKFVEDLLTKRRGQFWDGGKDGIRAQKT